MKKKVTPILKYFPRVKLYLNDIESIIDILKDSKYSDIEIFTNKGSYNLNELESIGKMEKLEKIQSREPFFSVEFDEISENHIYSPENNSLNLGITEKIYSILNKNKRTFLSFMTSFPLHISFLIVGLLTSYAGFYIFDLSKKTLSILLIFVSLFYATGFILSINKKIQRNISFFELKERSPGWFKRNKDDLATNFIVGLILFLLGLII